MFWYKSYIVFVLSGFTCLTLSSQNLLEIKVVDSLTQQAIQYAEVYNITNQNGTSTDGNGTAALYNIQMNDVININMLGYEEGHLNYDGKKQQIIILLKPKDFLISEITINADNEYLYKIINEASKRASKLKEESRAYFLLKTQCKDTVIEVIEAYYNAEVSGHKLNELNIKNGRVGLRPYTNGGYFISHSTTNILMKYDVSEENEEFPENPFNISLKELKKHYNLTLVNRFKDNNHDFIEIDFLPKLEKQRYFEGNVIIDLSVKQIAHLELNIKNAEKHPLLPIWPEDSLSQVNINLTYGFQLNNDQYRLNAINLVYDATYFKFKNNLNSFIIKSVAALNLYNFDELFILPYFSFEDRSYQRDYRHINAIPYNDYFWKEMAEFRINTEKEALNQFFEDTKVETNKTIFHLKSKENVLWFDYPYIHWTGERIIPKEASENIIYEKAQRTTYISDLYHFEIKIYFDFNKINDTITYMTATIFDQNKSFYHMKHNNNTRKFINISFDLHEVYRRKIHNQVQGKSYDEALGIYNSLNKELEKLMAQYYKEVDLGFKDDALKRWSLFVKNELDINNY